MKQESDKIEYRIQFQKENLKQLMDEFNGTKESEWLLVDSYLIKLDLCKHEGSMHAVHAYSSKVELN